MARSRAVPEIFIIAPYYKRLNQLKQASYRAARYQGLKPVLAEHDVEEAERQLRTTRPGSSPGAEVVEAEAKEREMGRSKRRRV